MKILKENSKIMQPVAMTIGLFDGIHRGHQELLLATKKIQGAKHLVYTFDTKPTYPKKIYTEEEKVHIFSQWKMDYYFSRIFNSQFALHTPEMFIEELVERFNLKHIVVGYDFRFGNNGVGDIELLRKYADKCSFNFTVVPRFEINGETVCSSRIRQLISDGDIRKVSAFLGRHYGVKCLLQNNDCRNSYIMAGEVLPPDGLYEVNILDNKTVKSIIAELQNGKCIIEENSLLQVKKCEEFPREFQLQFVDKLN